MVVMSTTRLATLLVLLPGIALAQVVSVTLPSIRFERPPPLVVVHQDVHVVEDYDDDLYVVRGRYYVRRGNHWYRAHDHRGQWRRIEHRHVPASLTRMTPGKYRRYKRAHHHAHRDERRDHKKYKKDAHHHPKAVKHDRGPRHDDRGPRRDDRGGGRGPR